jgi:predicted RNase H-like HicB family nuclease
MAPTEKPGSEPARFPALLSKNPGSDWSVEFPDFPGCVSAGITLDEAISHAQEALSLHVHGMRLDGQPLPVPVGTEKLMSKKRARTQALVLIPLIPLKGRAKRVNISLDENLLAEIDAAATAIGTDRSNFLATAARAKIERRTGS